MSLDLGVEHSRLSSHDGAAYTYLVTSYTLNRTSLSAGPIDDSPPGILHDVITFLAAAQWREIDILPITWQPALDTVGRGATAEIQQSIINLAMTFAFKRYFTSSDPHKIMTCYQAILAELCILGHPAIKEHPNIVKLQGVCWDVVTEDEVWPVLVTKKAKFGNLHDFMASDEAILLKPYHCLNLIAGILNAVATMHSYGIVHGDIKPENILVASDEINGFRAELCDFGYSTINANDNLIQLPSSWPWTAPEFHQRGFPLKNAQKTDIFSSGLVCLWLLHTYGIRRNSKTPTTLAMEHSVTKSYQTYLASYQWVDELRSAGDMFQSIDGCLNNLADFNKHQVKEMRAILSNMLDGYPDQRKLKMVDLSHRTPLETSGQPFVSSSEVEDLPTYLFDFFFQVPTSVEQLINSHASIRRYIAQRLQGWAEALVSNTLKEKASLQLAICMEIGFGVGRDVEKSSSLVEACKGTSEFIKSQLESLQKRTSWTYQNPEIQSLAENGFLREMDYMYEYRKLLPPETVARNLLQELVDTRQVYRSTHPVIVALSMQLISVFRSEGRLDDAQALLKQVLQDFEDDTDYPQNGREILNVQEALALVSKSQGNYDLARRLLGLVMEERKANLGSAHPFTMSVTNNLATIYQQEGGYDQAEVLFKEALEIASSEFGPEHPETLRIAGNLAHLLHLQGKLNVAEDAAAQVYQALEKMLGASHPNTLAGANNLASVLRSSGKLRASQTLYERILDQYERYNGACHPSTLNTLNSLAVIRKEQGHFDTAEKQLKQAISGRQALFGRRHHDTQTSINNLAGVMMQRNDFKSAEQLYTEVLESSQQTLGEEHHETVTSASNLAFAYQMQHNYIKAEELYRWAYDLTKKQVGEKHPKTFKILSNISGLFYNQGKLQDAESTYQQLLLYRTEVLGPAHPETLVTISNLAAVLMERGKLDEAELMNRKALDAKLQQHDRSHPSVLRTVNNLSNTLLARGDYAAAEEMALWAVEGRRTALGPNHPDTVCSGMILNQAHRGKRIVEKI